MSAGPIPRLVAIEVRKRMAMSEVATPTSAGSPMRAAAIQYT